MNSLQVALIDSCHMIFFMSHDISAKFNNNKQWETQSIYYQSQLNYVNKVRAAVHVYGKCFLRIPRNFEANASEFILKS